MESTTSSVCLEERFFGINTYPTINNEHACLTIFGNIFFGVAEKRVCDVVGRFPLMIFLGSCCVKRPW